MPGGEKRRQALKKVTEAAARHQNITWEEFTEKTFHATWLTDQFGGAKKINTKQIGGQEHGRGPDILKFIKKYDPQNSSGSVKDSLDIMLKLQEAANTGQLMSFIKPIKSTLGSDLYGKFVAAGSQSQAQEKVEEEEDDIILELIAAAIECAEGKRAGAGAEAAERLDKVEIKKIRKAYDAGGGYISTVMPQEFVDCINELIPVFKAREAVS